MASSEPFGQLTGILQVYLAPQGTAVPAVNATPGGSWYLLGATDGEQKLKHSGKLTHFRDNDHQGPVKSVRPEEDVMAEFTLVNVVLENYARILHAVANLVTVGGPPATRTMYLKRGAIPTEYSLLLKGLAASPYGAFPAMYVLTRVVFDDEPEMVFAKDGRPGLLCNAVVLEDDDYSDAQRMGWFIAQTA